jgi:hypothetical protein
MATRHCTNCGTAIPDGAGFCPSCGTKAPEVTATPASGAPAGSGFAPPGAAVAPPVTPEEAHAAGHDDAATLAQETVDAAPTEVTPVATPAPTPAVTEPVVSTPAATPAEPATAPVAAAPAGVVAPPPGGFSMARGGGSKTSGKTMAIAGGAAAVAVVFAGFFLFKGKEEPPAPPPVDNGGQVDPAAPEEPVDPAPVDPNQEPVAPEGDLGSLIPEVTGNFSLVEATQDPQLAANLGANDAYSLSYGHADGTPLNGALLAYSDSEGALAGLDTMVGRMQANYDYTVAQTVDITDPAGTYLGTGVNLTGPDEIWLWTNGGLFAWGESNFGYATEFFDNILAGT